MSEVTGNTGDNGNVQFATYTDLVQAKAANNYEDSDAKYNNFIKSKTDNNKLRPLSRTIIFEN